jgi:hypothetical protein
MKTRKIINTPLQITFIALIGLFLPIGCTTPTKQPMGGSYALTERDLKNDLALAKQHDAEACYRLHLHYSIGLGRHPEGFAWLRRSAEYGSPTGMYGYGVSLWNIAKNTQQKNYAKEWIRKAAEAGDSLAIKFLDRY